MNDWNFPEELEGLNYFSQRSKDARANRFDEDLFLPGAQVASERLIRPIFFTLLLISVSLFLFVLILRLSRLQIVDGEKNLAFSEGNRIRKERIRAQRGLILDRLGNVLARNLPTFSVLYNPQFCQRPDCSIEPLEKLASFDEIKERFNKNKSSLAPFVLASALSRDEILSLGNLDGFDFLQIESDQVRSYPYGPLFSHVIGFLGEASPEELESRPDLFLGDRIGKTGIEAVYDSDLQGVSGYNLVEVDAQESLKRFLSRREETAGRSLVLTVDKALQEASFEALSESLKKVDACCGAVVVEDVRNGAILSLVSLPAFDTNIFSSKDKDQQFEQLVNDKNLPFFNRAVSGAFPPGSVFKVVVAAGALAEKVVSKNTTLLAPGSISLGAFSYGDWKPGGHGLINIQTALAESADTFFYQIGGGYEGLKGLGPEKLAQYARYFGFGQPSFIDLPQEGSGLVPDPSWKKKVKNEGWYVGNTYHFSIGQGDLLTTPLQINQMTATVANGGGLF